MFEGLKSVSMKIEKFPFIKSLEALSDDTKLILSLPERSVDILTIEIDQQVFEERMKERLNSLFKDHNILEFYTEDNENEDSNQTQHKISK